jgi:hypothetical protein
MDDTNQDQVQDQSFSEEEEIKRIKLLYYDNLRKYFTIMVDVLLGEDYYNMGMDNYQVDINCMTDIVHKYANRKQKQKWDILVKYLNK